MRSSATSMMRKLSVASIASNFTKRSISLTSITFNPPSEEEHEDARGSSVADCAGASVSAQDPKNMLEKSPKLASMDDADLQFDSLFDEKLAGLTRSPTVDSPVGTMKRLTTLRVKNVLQHEGNRNITPPLRTPSANSLSQQKVARTASGGSLTQLCASPASDRSRESENQYPTKQGRWVKGAGSHHLVSTEGISRFFS